MGEIELRQPGYVAELIEVFNKAKRNGGGIPGGGGTSVFSGGSTSNIDGGVSSSSARTTDDPIHSRTTESLSEAESSLSRDLPITLSDYMRQSSSCLWSSPEGHSDSAEHCSVDVFATLRPPAKCVCVCNDKKCEYVKRHKSPTDDWRVNDGDAANRNPQLKKVFTLLRERKPFHGSYELTKSKSNSRWWKRRKTLEKAPSKTNVGESILNQTPLSPTILTPSSLEDTSPLPLRADALNRDVSTLRSSRLNGGNARIPEAIPLKTIQRQSADVLDAPSPVNMPHSNTNGSAVHTAEDDDNDDAISSTGSEDRLTPKGKVFTWLDQLKTCKYKPSPVRIVFLVLGSILFLMGISYDFALKHAIDGVLGNCWHSLKDEYISFGNKFIEYNKIMAEHRRSKRDSSFTADGNFVSSSSGDYWQKIADKDSKFIQNLEGLSISIQLHFFSLVDSITTDRVKVKDIGPLFLKVDFLRTRGFKVKFIYERSNMSLSTPFHVYDLMKMLLESNNLPHFGLHVKDYQDTTATALLNVFVNVLNKFNINTGFLHPMQSQTIWAQRLRRSRKNKIDDIDEMKPYEDIIRKSFLPLAPHRDEIVHIPVPILEKNLSLHFEGMSTVSDLTSMKFSHFKTAPTVRQSKYVTSSADKWDSRRQNLNVVSVNYKPVDSNYDPNSISNQYPMVIHLQPAIRSLMGNTKLLGEKLETYPFWLSTPHFLSSTKLDSNSYNPVQGFLPSREEHGSFIYYHPVLGVPMNASLAFQIGIRPPAKMLHGGRIVPIFWARVQLERIPSSLWHLFWFVAHLRVIMISMFVCLGLLLIVLAVTCRCTREPPPVYV